MKRNIPRVSVLMPVHNRAHYVGDAMASLLAQDFDDFEIVVVDDGSTDATLAVLEAIADPRLRIVRHPVNRGIPAARNTALEAARGDYIAWLDSDDTARPNRLSAQVAFLDANPEIALVGAGTGKLRPCGARRKGNRAPPADSADIAAWLLFRSAFQQSSVMGRAAILKRYPYRADFPVCEDLDVFIRIGREHRLANLPLTLIDRRIHPGQTVQRRRDAIFERKRVLAHEMLTGMGVAHGEDDLACHVLLGKATLDRDQVDAELLTRSARWLRHLRASNARSGALDPASLRFATSYVWLLLCRAALPKLGVRRVLPAVLGSSLSRGIFSRRALGGLYRLAFAR